MSTREITIQNIVFTVSQPYEAGHTINEAEAHSLNQTRAENIRNNFASKIKAKRKELELADDAELPQEAVEDLAAQVAAYDADYVFSLASAGGGARPKDPLEAEAIKLAKAAVAGKLKSMGVTVKAYTETEEGQTKYDNAVAQLAASEEYRKEAKKNLAAREKLASAGAAALDL